MRQIANNTFNGGILMDLNPLTTPNTVLTDVLNGTIITYDGNEFVLQSDDGNGVVLGCMLPKDFIPVGIKEYGGIIYIVSKNPFTQECEIGSFPAPEKFALYQDDKEPSSIINSELIENRIDGKYKGLKTFSYQLDFGDLNTLLRSGDKFCIYLLEKINQDQPDSDVEEGSIYEDPTKNKLEKLVEIYKEGELIERNLFKLKLLRTTDSGTTEDISNIVTSFKEKGIFWIDYNKFAQAQANGNIEGYFSTYINKINGYLTILFELEQIDEFDVNLSTSSTNNENKYNLSIKLTSKVSHKCKNNMFGAEFKLNGKSIEKEINTSKLTNIIRISENDIKVPSEEVSLEQEYTNLDKGKDYTLEITPYSKFNYFNNLKYINNINYLKLNYNKTSDVWKYYFDKSTDIEVESDKIKLSFDFVVKGTLNERNKLDCLYIQFYDVENNISLIYQVASIADNKTVTIDCYPKSVKDYTSSDNLLGSNSEYLLLIDKSKSIEYDKYLSKNDTLTNGYNTNLNIPYYYPVKDFIPMDGNKFTKPTKDFYLFSDHFYIVSIIGLDFYSKKESEKDNVKYYCSYNYLFTNGVFNKYWNNNSDVINFNTLDFPKFYDIQLNSQNWDDKIVYGERFTSEDKENDNTVSYQNYDDPVRSQASGDFYTRINVNGNITKKYAVNFIEKNDTLPSGMNIVKTISSIDFIPYKDSYTALNETELEIQENNNSETLKTNSSSSGYKLYSGNKQNVTKDTLNDINVEIQLASNRSVKTGEDTKPYVGNIEVFKPFKDVVPNIDPISRNIINLGMDTNHEQADTFISNSTIYSSDWNTVFPVDNPNKFSMAKKTKKYYPYTNSEILQRLNSYNLFGIIPLNLLAVGYDKFEKSGGFVGITGNLNIENLNNEIYIGDIKNLRLPGKGRTEINNKFTLLISCSSSGTFNKLVICPYTYQANTNDDFGNVITGINNNIKNSSYFKRTESKETVFIIPNTAAINKNEDFNSEFKFNINLGEITLSNIEVSIKNENLSSIINKLKSKIKTITDETNVEEISNTINTETLFDLTSIKCLPYFASNRITPINVTIKDSFIIESNRFMLKKNDQYYNINTVVSDLLNYNSYIKVLTVTIPEEDLNKIYYSKSKDYTGFRYNFDKNFIYYDGLITGHNLPTGGISDINGFRALYAVAGESAEVSRSVIGIEFLLTMKQNSELLAIGTNNSPIFNVEYGYPHKNQSI